jgi:glycosyltransferase involved in cell wall biosynthesis
VFPPWKALAIGQVNAMKILILSNYYPPYFEGGYELSCQETADYLLSQNHTVYVLTGNKGITTPLTCLPQMKVSEPVRILHYIDYLKGGYWDKHAVEVFNYRVTRQAIKQVKPDIIYIWGMKAVSISPVIAVQDSHYPRLFDIGDFWPLVYQNPSLASRCNRLVKKLLPFTIGGNLCIDPAIVISQWMVADMHHKLGSKDVHVIPRSIEIPPDQPGKIPHQPLKYLFIGRIEPMKGLHLCLSALGSLTGSIPDFAFELNIYGDVEPDYYALCQKLIIENGLSDRVHFFPRTSKVDELYWQHDIMLMPTLAKEAFGRVVIEAMARRCIVIATNAYGPAEIITQAKDGFLFTRNDAGALTDAIREAYLLTEAELSEIGKQARKTVEDKYELSLVKKQIIDKLEYYRSKV